MGCDQPDLEIDRLAILGSSSTMVCDTGLRSSQQICECEQPGQSWDLPNLEGGNHGLESCLIWQLRDTPSAGHQLMMSVCLIRQVLSDGPTLAISGSQEAAFFGD